MGHELTHGFDDRGISFLLHKYPYTAAILVPGRSWSINRVVSNDLQKPFYLESFANIKISRAPQGATLVC